MSPLNCVLYHLFYVLGVKSEEDIFERRVGLEVLRLVLDQLELCHVYVTVLVLDVLFLLDEVNVLLESPYAETVVLEVDLLDVEMVLLHFLVVGVTVHLILPLIRII